jgi:hypothetical protein
METFGMLIGPDEGANAYQLSVRAVLLFAFGVACIPIAADEPSRNIRRSSKSNIRTTFSLRHSKVARSAWFQSATRNERTRFTLEATRAEPVSTKSVGTWGRID